MQQQPGIGERVEARQIWSPSIFVSRSSARDGAREREMNVNRSTPQRIGLASGFL
ncbi:MAG TPA: hypothetical protein VF780_05720 [Nitrosospira sp.]